MSESHPADDLTAWTRRRDEAAFQRLVERHSGLVAAVCRRQLGNGAASDEAAQAVFIILARRAGSVTNSQVLPFWLHRVALGVCRDSRRAEARRISREHEAAMSHADNQQASAAEPTSGWADLRPHLDHAIASLGARDREMVIGHFLHGLPQAAIAARLGISENAAQKRIAVALGKLRAWFAKRGVPVGASILAAGLASEAGAAEPALTAACAQTALHPATAAAANALASGYIGAGIAKLTAVGLALVLAGGAAAAVHVLAKAAPPSSIPTPAGVPPSPSAPVSAATSSEKILTYDFEDGIRPRTLIDGDIVPGPERTGTRFCLSAIRKPHSGSHKNEIVFSGRSEALFHADDDLRLSFDCWLTGESPGVSLELWDDMQKRDLISGAPVPAHGRWVRIDVPLADFHPGDGSQGRVMRSDVIGNLVIASSAEAADATLFIDNVMIRKVPPDPGGH